MIHTSRSRMETFQECQRRGYINFLWDGRGLVKRGASVYLSTGSYTHIGLEFIFQAIQKCGGLPTDFPYVIDDAVKRATTAYAKEISERGFDLEEGENVANQQFIVYEQCALVEAFIRSFALRVLPDLLARFRVVDVEREEIVVINNLILQGKLDVTFEEINSSDLYIVSFKTAAGWDRRQEKANEHDNQGLSETFCLESRLHKENRELHELIDKVEESTCLGSNLPQKTIEATKKYVQYLYKFEKHEKVMGVLMIYMIKGKRYESYSNPGRWEQHSPLIRAYRKVIGTEFEYAGSLWYDNPSNKSGKGKLGKGWESFNVWESEEVGFVKGWIAKAANNELGSDIIGETFKIPSPYFRRQDHIDSWVRQIISIEAEISSKQAKLVDPTIPFNGMGLVEKLDMLFHQTKKHCHYPNDCSYLDICYNNEVFDDPIGSGKFMWRVPHHQKEKEEHERLYEINVIQENTTKLATVAGETKKEQKGNQESFKDDIRDEDIIEDI